eukprot:190595-Pyramimonas_sp.AAC.1
MSQLRLSWPVVQADIGKLQFLLDCRSTCRNCTLQVPRSISATASGTRGHVVNVLTLAAADSHCRDGRVDAASQMVRM